VPNKLQIITYAVNEYKISSEGFAYLYQSGI